MNVAKWLLLVLLALPFLELAAFIAVAAVHRFWVGIGPDPRKFACRRC